MYNSLLLLDLRKQNKKLRNMLNPRSIYRMSSLFYPNFTALDTLFSAKFRNKTDLWFISIFTAVST